MLPLHNPAKRKGYYTLFREFVKVFFRYTGIKFFPVLQYAGKEGGESVKSTGKLQVAVVGGGAGGLAAAIAAAEGGASVKICERANRVGKKLLKTGNGRCNLTHQDVRAEDYNCPDFVAPVLEQTDTAALLDFFRGLGLWTVTDAEGRVYPRSDTAASVLDVLRLRCGKLGVEECCSCEVAGIGRRRGAWLLRFADGGSAEADRVIVASGGGTRLTAALGIPQRPFAPVLCPLKTDVRPIRGLSGLRARCVVTLEREGRALCAEAGEVLFRDYGLSGIVILNMSRLARAGDVLALDLLPEWEEAALSAALRSRRQDCGEQELLTGVFHRRLGEALLRLAPGDTDALARYIKRFPLTVEGAADTANAQVTRGGAAVESFDPATLQCRDWEGLYVIGEALDVDGRCGGYNLHWAFASGLAAGRSAVYD